jgi:hypothetical protein
MKLPTAYQLGAEYCRVMKLSFSPADIDRLLTGDEPEQEEPMPGEILIEAMINLGIEDPDEGDYEQLMDDALELALASAYRMDSGDGTFWTRVEPVLDPASRPLVRLYFRNAIYAMEAVENYGDNHPDEYRALMRAIAAEATARANAVDGEFLINV